MEKSCSACSKDFLPTDNVIRTTCGHLVHYFKKDCCENDFCIRCQKIFYIYSTSSIVDSKTPDETSDMKRKISNEEEAQAKVAEEKETAEEKDPFYMEKFAEQRKINLEIMKKLTVLTKSQENLIEMFKEQAKNSKMIIESLTKIITQELPIIKRGIEDLNEQMDDLLYEDCEDHMEN